MGPIRTLDDILDMLRRRASVIFWVILLGAMVSLWVAAKQQHFYESSAVLQITRPKIADDLAKSTVDGSSARRLQLIEQRLMARGSVLDIIEKFGLYQDLPGLVPSEKVALLRESVSLTGVAAAREGFADDGTISVLTISALMPTPEQAQAVASEFATRTIELSQSSRIEQARETLTFFVDKETALISEVAELENEITAYRNANNVALPGGIEMRREEISTLNTGLLEIEREQIELRRQADQTTSNQRQATAQRMLEVFEEKLATLDAQRELLLNRRSALERSLETTPEVERQLGVYERRMGQLQTELELISQRRTEAEVGFRLEASRQSERLTVIESAPLPDYPATGGRKKKALMGGVASIGLALGIAFLLELRRPVLRSVAQMERETGLTPVVAIPFLDTSSKRRGVFARLRMALGGRRRTGTEPSG
ncbi:chain-length determining protein [Phaeobacter piscinae]|uniref:chain-length determining protein n=1 Tax=Phaeobacter piscinae TaxID=1580596 RepID=UPI00058DF87E|nr:chain-length determining protein [Phaeobacter piscinae]ATG38580.1 polysaccharide chain length determinant protein, PEP-CTERM locus subfamily [Phaeobacter piscinae]AUQ75438.1 polysaccharide chain length determinant protein, PEP-CTERM locus subfamily [Phaeobacter piscinae]UTS79423.1 hypothetical protein OL67_000470 [Phaeobacter piscinae]